MCQRKIIGKGVFNIVPVDPGPSGCRCPAVTQIRDVDAETKLPHPVTYPCRDIKTIFEMNGYPVTFRFCKCETAECAYLPQKTICSEKFGGVDLSKEIWTEDGKGMTYEPGFVDPDYTEDFSSNIGLI